MDGDPAEPADSLSQRVERIREHHVHDLPLRQAEAVVLQGLGLDDRAAAKVLEISPETVRRHASLARGRVVPPGMEATRANATLWVFVHERCCLARLFTHFLGGFLDSGRG